MSSSEPLKHSIAERGMAKDMHVRSYQGKLRLEQLSPFLFAISSASLLWYSTHSSAIPPVVVKTRGVNDLHYSVPYTASSSRSRAFCRSA